MMARPMMPVFATRSDLRFVEALLELCREDERSVVPGVGDVVEIEMNPEFLLEGSPNTRTTTVIEVHEDEACFTVRDRENGRTYCMPLDFHSSWWMYNHKNTDPRKPRQPTRAVAGPGSATDGDDDTAALHWCSWTIAESVQGNALWDSHQQHPFPDGVAYADGIVPSPLVAALHTDLDRLIALEPEDYHPGTGTRVRDLVHPSLYPFVAGRSVRMGRPEPPAAASDAASTSAAAAPPSTVPPSRLEQALPETADVPGEDSVSWFKWLRNLARSYLPPFLGGAQHNVGPEPSAPPATVYDRFGRTYESSQYQWLPTPFHVDAHGGVTIPSYINNLSRERHPDAYANLASLFATALPLIESVVGYVDTTRFYDDDDDPLRDHPIVSDLLGAPSPPTFLRDRELLVIPKIVEYRLRAGETHEGVWHVEGMSHEHIVATCVYVLDRDAALEGGDLCFKRAYTEEEGARLFWNVGQERPGFVNEFVDRGTIPIGRVAMPAGRLLVFPNSHIHMLTKLAIGVGAEAKEARRRVIVFWIVDPAVTDLPSTRDVAPQQEAAFSRDEALAMRLELMEERKRHKQSLNVRAVSLCEH